MAKKTLLQKAKELKPVRERKVTKEHIELAMAWVNNEIGISQAIKAVTTSSPSAGYALIAHSLKKYIQNKRIGKK